MAFAQLGYEPLRPDLLQEQIASSAFGAYAVFTGNVRNNANGKKVVSLAYDAYEPLARKELLRIAQEAEARWPGSCAVAHRLGSIPMGESSVVVVFASAHRDEAFAACRWAIDTLKESAPIWKHEVYEEGSAWI